MKKDALNDLTPLLSNRSTGSIRMGLQNVSAVLSDMGLMPLDGFSPLDNYRSFLPEMIQEWIKNDSGYQQLIQQLDELVQTPKDAEDDILNAITDPPPKSKRVAQSSPVSGTLGKPDYDAQGRRQRELGQKGEKWVLEFERQRLCAAGQSGLAKKIDYVASHHDGCGYDIRSFNEDGSERLIEVKTTNFGPTKPFLVTVNEISVSAEKAGSYFLYRVYNYSGKPTLYFLQGSIMKNYALKPIQFKAYRQASAKCILSTNGGSRSCPNTNS